MSKPFRSFTCDGFAKVRCFSEGQRTEGHFLYPGASNAITIIVDLRSEHDLKVLLEVGHTDSATNMQVIGLTHRPTGFHGRRWYFVSENGKRWRAGARSLPDPKRYACRYRQAPQAS